MASAEATDFLTKQIYIQKETVTFRWLSRALSIHVNEAKNQLALFHASSLARDEHVYATYLLMGDVAPLKAFGPYESNGDVTGMELRQESEAICTRMIVLVGEDDLRTAKTQFTRSPSVHIYSLSPAVIKDAAFLVTIADRVRDDDVSKGQTFNKMIGIVVGSDVKLGYTNKSAVAKAMMKPAASMSSSKASSSVLAKEDVEKPKASEAGKATARGKQSDVRKKGTLDWTKSTKPKAQKETITTNSKEEVKPVSKANSKGERASSKTESKAGVKTVSKNNAPSESKAKPDVAGSKQGIKLDETVDKPKRGTKRPSEVMSLSDSEEDNRPKNKRISLATASSGPAPCASNVKVKKGVLLSEEEGSEDDVQTVKAKQSRQKGKRRAVISDAEDEIDSGVRIMMNLDDSEVIQNIRSAQKEEEEDIEMMSDSEPMLAKPKRKPKKVIPVGSNGLPKRRVVKSRKSKNAKGYTVTEDYSSYESVSESELPVASVVPEKKPKRGRKPKKGEGDSVSAPQKTLKRKPSVKGKDEEDDNVSKTPSEAEDLRTDTTVDQKKTGTGSNAGDAKSSFAMKTKSSGKSNLMNYFAKK